jgi:hypothetical protein
MMHNKFQAAVIDKLDVLSQREQQQLLFILDNCSSSYMSPAIFAAFLETLVPMMGDGLCTQCAKNLSNDEEYE